LLDGALVSFRRLCWPNGGLRSLAGPPGSGFFRLTALVRLQPGERARFPCGEILADVSDGLSVPVIRSGNTGKSRFLGASLRLFVPTPFQDSGRTVPIADDLFQSRLSRAEGGRHTVIRRCPEPGPSGATPSFWPGDAMGGAHRTTAVLDWGSARLHTHPDGLETAPTWRRGTWRMRGRASPS